MHATTMPAQAGWEWLVEAATRLRRQPQAALTLALTLALASLLPMIGWLLLAVLLPPLYGSLQMLLAHGPMQASPRHLFEQLRGSPRLLPLLTLALAPLAFGMATFAVLYLFLGGQGLSGGVAHGNLAVAELGLATLLLPLFSVAALGALLLVLFFAVPLVALRGMAAVPALRASYAASLTNLPALLVMLAILLFGSLLIVVPTMAFGLKLALVVVGLVLHPLLAAAMAVGEAEVFQRDAST